MAAWNLEDLKELVDQFVEHMTADAAPAPAAKQEENGQPKEGSSDGSASVIPAVSSIVTSVPMVLEKPISCV